MPRSKTKGLILVGGKGSRLYPVTSVVCKQLLPIYDKPMIYYPLSTLMQAGITEIMIISTPQDRSQFERLLGDGSRIGLSIVYGQQERAVGIAQAFLIAEQYIGNDKVAFILGDNIFHGVTEFASALNWFSKGALVFGYKVDDPHRFGIIEFDSNGEVLAVEEKPTQPKSNYAVTGLYLYDSTVVEIARALKPSDRGELEITDVNNAYIEKGQLKTVLLNSDVFWVDAGTSESMLEAGTFVAASQKKDCRKIACIEEVAYRHHYIDRQSMQQLVEEMGDCDYRSYLIEVIEDTDGRS